MKKWSACPDETEIACQAAIWGADRLAARRQGREFIEAHGLANNYLTRIRDLQNPPMSVLLAMARWFEMSLEEMLEQAWAQRDGGEEDRLGRPKTVPPICNAALLRFSQAAPKLGNREMCQPLEYLDDVRYSDPMNALFGLQNLVPEVATEQIPYLLQVAASCFRTVCDFREAAHCLRVADDIATNTTENLFAVGDNLRRWVYLYDCVGYRRAALERSKQAHDLFLELGHEKKIGESVVDRAYCLYYLEQFSRSFRTYDSALNLFYDILNLRYRIAALQGKAGVCIHLGEVEEARRLCDRALTLAKNGKHQAGTLGNCLWMLGRAEKEAGNQEGAVDCLLKASESLKTASPIDALLATLECFEIQIMSGNAPKDLDRLSGEIASQLGNRVPEITAMLENLSALPRLGRVSLSAIQDAGSRIKQLKPAYLKMRASHLEQ